MKFTLRGGIFNTWPHYGEWAERCVSALLAFALTMFILENYMIFGWNSWPTFCCDIHTVKIIHWINNLHTYYITTPQLFTCCFISLTKRFPQTKSNIKQRQHEQTQNTDFTEWFYLFEACGWEKALSLLYTTSKTTSLYWLVWEGFCT